MQNTGTPVGSYAPDFELPGIDQEVHHLARYLDKYQAVGVVFMDNQSPDQDIYLDKLKQLQGELQDQGFTIIGINAQDVSLYPQESLDNMKTFSRQQDLNFPYLRDTTQEVAQSFGVEQTPMVFLLDRSGILRYSGPLTPAEAAVDETSLQTLRQAIQTLLQ